VKKYSKNVLIYFKDQFFYGKTNKLYIRIKSCIKFNLIKTFDQVYHICKCYYICTGVFRSHNKSLLKNI